MSPSPRTQAIFVTLGLAVIASVGYWQIVHCKNPGDRAAIASVIVGLLTLLSTAALSWRTLEYSRVQAAAAEVQAAAALIERRAGIADACYSLMREAVAQGNVSPEMLGRYKAVTVTQAEWLLSSSACAVIKKLAAQAQILNDGDPPAKALAFDYFLRGAHKELEAKLEPYKVLSRRMF